MADSSATLHEPADQLRAETIDRHRAIVSLMEELEVIDWYDQRVDAATDAELRAILALNRDEEKEHAAMMLEWLRRHDPGLDEQLKTYLFTERPVLEVEEAESAAEAAEGTAGPLGAGSGVGDGSLNIGSLKVRLER